MKTALIIGVGGQDGSYLAEHLVESEEYEVYGVHRRTSTSNLDRFLFMDSQTVGRIRLHQGDLCDTESIMHLIDVIQPDEVYNLADQDDVRWSYAVASYNYDVTGAAVGRLLNAISKRPYCEEIRFFQAISATIFGNKAGAVEHSRLDPRSPYACAKAFALHLCRYYRRAGMHVSTAILFNHDSPRRGPGYLLQKICRHIMEKTEYWDRPALPLYAPDTQIDVGPAKEYVKKFPLILNLNTDIVLGNRRKMTVRELAELALATWSILTDDDYQTEEFFEFAPGDLTEVLLSMPTKAEDNGIDCQFFHSDLLQDILTHQLQGSVL